MILYNLIAHLYHDIYFTFSGTSETVFGPDTGKKCHFPFNYKSVTYQGCTEKDSPGRPWCGTEKEYTHESYGYCDCPSGR